MSRWHGGKGSRTRPSRISRTQYEANLSLALTKKPIKTGFEQLDDSIEIVRGGITTFYSNTGGGKTISLLNVATNIANDNLKTIVITNELTESTVIGKVNSINGSVPSKMIIKHLNTVNDIVKFMSTQYSVDVLVLDYINWYAEEEEGLQTLIDLAADKKLAIIASSALPRAGSYSDYDDALLNKTITQYSSNVVIVEDFKDNDAAGFYQVSRKPPSFKEGMNGDYTKNA